MLWGILGAPLIVLFVAWVAALTNVHQRWTMDELESWDNGLAHPVGPLCAVLGCTSEPTAAYGRGRDLVEVCATHDPL